MTETRANDLTDPELRQVSNSGLISRITHSLTEMASLSEVLRMLGALIMVASMSLFLLQDWHQGSDVNRYFLLLIQTVLMAGGGLALSFLLKENKGARVFFNLSLISVVANFTILGALIYSTVQWDGLLTSYPKYAHWVVQADQSIITAMLAAAVVLLPITVFGFMITARPVALRLSGLYLGLNALLLLPVRESFFTGVLALGGLLVLPVLLKKVSTGYEHFNTPGGHFIKALLFTPLLIILVRSGMWYAMDSVLITGTSLGLFLILRAFSLQQNTRNKTGATLATIADGIAHLCSFGIAIGVGLFFYAYLDSDLILPVSLGILALTNFELSTRISNRFVDDTVNLITALVVAGGFIFHMSITYGDWPILLCMMANGLLITYGWVQSNRLVLIPGIIGFGYSTMVASQWVVELAMEHGWITLAVTGAVIIVLASLLERHGTALKLRFTHH